MSAELYTTIRSFIGQHVRDTELTDDHDIFATGSVSSLFAVQLVMWVERTFRITVQPTDLDIENFRTVNDVVKFVESRQGAAAAA
ncbi:acyl carrier protein [Streptomyces sp. ET3-23]|uniref:acyl carrier protein n=1 Tax=Streptomyces sp. ET3-23 TaxID=2885643 RepID=UPI001D10DB37|nr:acyl carrier protein [Streptomyces sp. ET3-23]MCC2274658.1 acyl carrier protein [Streptomyces sp. ET3-23]